MDAQAKTAAASPTGERINFAGRAWDAFDLSYCLSNKSAAIEKMPHKIEYTGHKQTAENSINVFGIGKEYWPDELGWAQEVVTLSTHAGTHVDAPWHYAPTSAGAPAQTIDQLPLQWFMGDAFVLDMCHIDREEGIRAADIEAGLKAIGHEIKAHDIALIRTDISEQFGEAGYDQLHPGLRACATRYLLERGVKLIGIDAWGIDRPFELMVKDAKAGDKEQLWESHLVGKDIPYSQIEKVVNLKALPRSTGLFVIALPINLEGASGAWSRVIALVPAE
ncbi:cyclase family protein [Octadecabacter sp.]|nr:cyclase family protein [Octadecabacter sp.]